MLSVFVALFISFKYDFYVDAERMIAKTRNVKKYLRRWFKKCMARYLFRSFLRRLLCSTLYCHGCLCISNVPHFPRTKETMQKVKHGKFAWLNPRHVSGLGAWLKLTGTLYLLGESSPEQKADA